MDGGTIADHGELQSRGIKRKNSKEKHGEGEEELTNSPKQRKKAPNSPQMTATFNRNSPRFSNSPTRFHG
jgi:hypothetical protein